MTLRVSVVDNFRELFSFKKDNESIDTNVLCFVFSGLFHKAISESGTALVPWAEAAPGEPKLNAFRLAKFLNCPQAPSERMIKCLRSLDSYDIIDTEFKFYVRANTLCIFLTV